MSITTRDKRTRGTQHKKYTKIFWGYFKAFVILGIFFKGRLKWETGCSSFAACISPVFGASCVMSLDPPCPSIYEHDDMYAMDGIRYNKNPIDAADEITRTNTINNF